MYGNPEQSFPVCLLVPDQAALADLAQQVASKLFFICIASRQSPLSLTPSLDYYTSVTPAAYTDYYILIVSLSVSDPDPLKSKK